MPQTTTDIDFPYWKLGFSSRSS